MARLKAYFLLMTVSIFTFSQFAIILNFLSNQDFIAQNLCENIERPELECNGKCYLMKKLKEDEKQKGGDKIVHSEVILFLDSKTIKVVLGQLFFETKTACFNLKEKRTTRFIAEIFHPPIVIV